MPIIDLRARIPATGRRKTAGYWRVSYKDTNGKIFAATVVGPGSGSGLKLRLPNRIFGSKIIDNVAVMTVRTQTNVYFDRTFA